MTNFSVLDALTSMSSSEIRDTAEYKHINVRNMDRLDKLDIPLFNTTLNETMLLVVVLAFVCKKYMSIFFSILSYKCFCNM